MKSKTTYNHFEHIPKPKLNRVIELYNSTLIINDSLTQIRLGKYYFIGVLYSQIRSLLIDKTTKPLLPLVAELVNYDLDLYYVDGSKLPPEIENSLILQMVGPPLSINREIPGQIKINLIDYLKTTVLTVNNQNIRVNTLIEHLANKNGGAHYSDDLPRYLVDLMNFGFNNQPLVNNYIIQLAELCLNLSVNTLKTISDFEIIQHVYIPKQKLSSEQFIFDYKLPNNNCRIYVSTIQSKFRVGIIDLLGRFISIVADQIIDFGEFFLLNLVHSLDKDVTSEITLYVNEVKLISKRLDGSIFPLNEIRSYDRYLNRSIGSENTELEIGMLQHMATGKVLDLRKRLELFNYMQNNEKSKMAWFNKSSYGECKSGNTTMVMRGKVQYVDVKDYIDDDQIN